MMKTMTKMNNLLDDLDLLLESIIEDEDTEGDVSSFTEPTEEPFDPEVLVNEFEDCFHNGSHGYFQTAVEVANNHGMDVYDVINAFSEFGDEDTAQMIMDDMK